MGIYLSTQSTNEYELTIHYLCYSPLIPRIFLPYLLRNTIKQYMSYMYMYIFIVINTDSMNRTQRAVPRCNRIRKRMTALKSLCFFFFILCLFVFYGCLSHALAFAFSTSFQYLGGIASAGPGKLKGQKNEKSQY